MILFDVWIGLTIGGFIYHGLNDRDFDAAIKSAGDYALALVLAYIATY